MKRVGILTFHFPENRNYGAILQSYACMKMIEKLNNEVKIIDYNYSISSLSLKGKIIEKLESINFKKFSKKYLKKTDVIKNKDQLKDLKEKFDIFLVGSDQVWRAKWLKENVKTYFLDFTNEKNKKISYAASFGIDYWEGDRQLTEEIKKLIKKFDYISVREESGIDICKENFEIENVSCVLDPTLMLEEKDYVKLISNNFNENISSKRKYVAYMFLHDTMNEECKNISKYLNLDLINIKGKKINIFGKSLTLYNEVPKWLKYLKNSELVITDSFHCTVFSLIFHKKFIVYGAPTKGIARLETLLEKVGLRERLFTNIEDVIKNGILDKEIDYTEVDKKLEVHRKYSMEFLKRALED